MSFSIRDSRREVDAANWAIIPGYLSEGGNLFEFLRTIKPELN